MGEIRFPPCAPSSGCRVSRAVETPAGEAGLRSKTQRGCSCVVSAAGLLFNAVLRPTLREPRLELLVAEDDAVLAGLEHDLEIAAVDRLLRPPAVDDTPFLAHDGDGCALDRPRDPVE